MKWIHKYFGLTTGEKYGFWVLMALIVAGLSLPPLIQRQTTSTLKIHKKQFEKEVEQFMEAQGANKTGSEKPKLDQEKNLKREYFEFDPNKIEFKELKKLGLPDKLAHTIINYKEAGGRFEKPSDLKAIYGMPDSTYERLKPCLNLTEKRPENSGNSKNQTKNFNKGKAKKDQKKKTSSSPELPDIAPLALNEADSARLTKLYGIGDFFAQEIIERRQRLGGFVNFRQLLAIYNFDSSNLHRVKPQLTIDKSKVNKLSLADDEFEDFLKHPYFSYAQVKAIFDYKDRIDKNPDPQDLKEDKVLGEKRFQKIRPYLKK